MKLVQVFGEIAQEQVLDVRHPGTAGFQQADNDYWTVIFTSMTCPAALQEVTSVIVGEITWTPHHFQRIQTLPCRRCFNPQHMRQ